MSKDSQNIRKKAEFEEFIRILKSNTSAHWIQIAEVLGVNKDTITEWKKLPEAKKAIKEGIRKNLEGMEKAGAKDWRMYESKLKMLGLSPIDRHDLTSDDKPIPFLKMSDVLPNDSNGEVKETE